MTRWGLFLGLVLGCLLLANLVSSGWRKTRPYWTNDPLAALPRVFLWAWERPEDLRFLDCGQAGVAFLAATIQLEQESVRIRPRLQPFRAPDACGLIAVVRIETSRALHATLTAEQRKEVVQQLARVGQRPGIAALQIDFDARESERRFYREVLQDLRPLLPDSVKLSITALASWCIHDPWISDLPVEEAVPMLFRMGVDEAEVRSYLGAGNDFRPGICGFSVGVSTDAAPPAIPPGRRLYIFHTRPWTSAAAAEALKKAQTWQ